MTKPNNEKPWTCHCHGRFGSGGWEFKTFEDAMAYATDQRKLADARFLSDFRAKVTGPDGTNMVFWSNYWN